MTVFGPYDTERQALAEPMPQAVRALHDSGRARCGDPDRIVFNTILGHLLSACQNAGVQLGEHDRRNLAWLCRGETSTVQVVIGLINRAYAAGRVEQQQNE